MREDEKMKAFIWQKRETMQYNLRFMRNTGIPDALERASRETGETTTEYIKTSLILRLREDGFIPKESKIVLNLNKQRHKEKLKKLEEYLEKEKQKIK